jgi:MYXO-CTERM domain-containing protein
VSTTAELDFGVGFVGTSVRRSLTLHNAGTVAITASSLAFGDPQFSVVSTDRTIPPLGDLVVEVEYAPTAEGQVVEELAIALDADPEPQLAVTLRGAGFALDPPTDPWTPGEPPLYFAPGAAPADPAVDGGSGGCATHGGASPLAVLALVLALVPVLRRRRRAAPRS